MHIPSHPELLSNSRVEDIASVYQYLPLMTTQTANDEDEGGGGNGEQRPSIHMRRRRCSATPVLTGRSAVPSPRTPTFGRSPLHTPRRVVSTPLTPSQTPRRVSTPITANAHMSARNHQPLLNGHRTHLPPPLAQASRANGSHPAEYGAVAGEGHVLRAPEGVLRDVHIPGNPDDMAQGGWSGLSEDGVRTGTDHQLHPQPREGGIIAPHLRHLVTSDLPISSPLSTSLESFRTGEEDCSSTRPPVPSAPPSSSSSSQRLSLPPLSVTIGPPSGKQPTSRDASQASSTTSSTQSATRQHDNNSRELLRSPYSPSPLTARPFSHSARTPTMARSLHGDLRTPTAAYGNGGHRLAHAMPCSSPVDVLNAQAPRYWCDKRSSDLFLVVPTHLPDGRPKAVGRRFKSSSPNPSTFNAVPSMGFAVHSDYLRPQCALLDRVLSSSVPQKGGCLLPSAGQMHQVLLPLPDPKSFPFLLHWLYWGDVGAFERALSSGTVNWNGVVANADYLDVDARTKRVVAHWWRKWVQCAPNRPQPEEEDSDEADDESGALASDDGAPHTNNEHAAEEMARLMDDL